MNYDEKYPDEVLRGIDGSLAMCISALRTARCRIDVKMDNISFTCPNNTPSELHLYEAGLEAAIDEIDDLIVELIDACTKES